ncbi:MAG TPA: SRPBCC family protein [Ornithinibacter sp.]|nr:SRPBCC family protein [Ornithinibacter sp.]
MIDVTRESTAPVDRLWSTISAVRDWPQWLPTVDAVTPLDPARPDEVGASYTVEQPGLPKAVWTITAWEEGRSFTWESRSPGIRSVGTHTLLPSAHGSTTIELGIAWSGVLAPLVRLALGRKSLDYVTREAAALDATAGATSDPGEDTTDDAASA